MHQLPAIALSPNPKDSPIHAMAVAGKGHLLVSGDKGDLLALDSVQGIDIVTAAQALARLAQQTANR